MQKWGKTPTGEEVMLYTLTNGKGMTAKIATYGATLTELHVPDRTGKEADVVLGFDSLDGYLKGSPYFGATVGRVANRIAGGKFTLDGNAYTLATNNGPNSLHGGTIGWDKKVWKAEPKETEDGPAVTFTYVSPDGEEGYPGTVTATVTYTVLKDSNTLRLDYTATTDKDTPINLTNHSYFNLKGGGSILSNRVILNSNYYTPVDATLIPTGEVATVKGTPMDFTKFHTIGERIRATGGTPYGYDHNYVRNGAGAFGLAAYVDEPISGRRLEMRTSEPAFQFYTSNFLDGTLVGKDDMKYRQYNAFCLEAQHYPDSVNRPEFPTTIVKPGDTYRQRTEYTFSAL